MKILSPGKSTFQFVALRLEIGVAGMFPDVAVLRKTVRKSDPREVLALFYRVVSAHIG